MLKCRASMTYSDFVMLLIYGCKCGIVVLPAIKEASQAMLNSTRLMYSCFFLWKGQESCVSLIKERKKASIQPQSSHTEVMYHERREHTSRTTERKNTPSPTQNRN
jgi:hypothetical protein